MFCSKCGKEYPDNVVFCSNCGNNLASLDGLQSTTIHNQNVHSEDAILEVFRESWSSYGLAEFIIMIDGKEYGRINDGEQQMFKVIPGRHELQIKMAYSIFGESSPKITFTVSANETIKFSCRPAYGFWGVMLGVKRLYYLTIGRKSFIVLKKA